MEEGEEDEEPGPCLDSEEEPKPRGGGLGSEEALKKLRYSPCGGSVCVCGDGGFSIT